MLIIMILLCVLVVAVAVLFVFLIKKQKDLNTHAQVIHQLENKVEALEKNLQKTLEIMQDLAKKMNVQQEVFDIHAQKIKQVESQQSEVLTLLNKITSTDSNSR